MSFLSRPLRAISYTSLHNASYLALLILIQVTAFTPRVALTTLAFAFLVTAIYLQNKSADLNADLKNSRAILTPAGLEKNIFLIYLALSVAGFLLLTSLKLWSLVAVFVFLLSLGWLYNRGMSYSNTHPQRWKNILWLKNLIPAASWGLVAGFVPQALQATSTETAALTGLQVFFAIFSIEVCWDIRDLSADQKAGVRTLPNTFSLLTAKMIASGALFISWMICLANGAPEFFNLIFPIQFLLITQARPDRSVFYYQAFIYLWLVPVLLYFLLKSPIIH